MKREETSRIRRRVWISGHVQGVWFRESTRKQAEAHDVAGWVKNLSDGRVEAVLEGEPRAVQALLEWCRRGPPSARVMRVEEQEETPVGETAFRVVR